MNWHDKQAVLARLTWSPHAILKADPALQNDRAFIVEAVRVAPTIYPFLHETFHDDQEITLLAVKNHGEHLRHASSRLQANFDIVLAAIIHHPVALRFASYDLKDNVAIVEAAIKGWPGAIKYASNELRDNKEVVISALKTSYDPYYDISKRLQQDEDVIRLALSHVSYRLPSSFLPYSELPDHLKKNRDFMLFLISKVPDLYPEISNTYQHDRDFVKAYVTNFGYSFKGIPEQFMHDKEIALLLVNNKGIHLKHVATFFGDDKDVVTAAINSRGMALEFASPRLQKDIELCASAFSREKKVLAFIDESIIDTPQIVALRIKHGQLQYNDLPLNLREDVLVTSAALAKAKEWELPNSLNIPAKILNDATIVKAACKKDIDFLKFASAELLNNKAFILEFIDQGSHFGVANLLSYVSAALQNDKEVVTAAIKLHSMNFKYASSAIRDDERVGLIAINARAGLFNLLSARLKNDEHFLKKALPQNREVYCYLNEEQRANMKFATLITNSAKALHCVPAILANDKTFIDLIISANHGSYLENLKSEHFTNVAYMKSIIAQSIGARKALIIDPHHVPNFKLYLSTEHYEFLASLTHLVIRSNTPLFDIYFTAEYKGGLSLRDFDRELLFMNHPATLIILANLKGRRHKQKLLIDILFNAITNDFMNVVDLIFREKLIRPRVILHHYGRALQTKNEVVITHFNNYIKDLPLTYDELLKRKEAAKR